MPRIAKYGHALLRWVVFVARVNEYLGELSHSTKIKTGRFTDLSSRSDKPTPSTARIYFEGFELVVNVGFRGSNGVIVSYP